MKNTIAIVLVLVCIVVNFVYADDESNMGEIREYILANFIRKANPEFTGTLTQTDGAFKTDSDGTVRTPRLILAPQSSVDDLGYEPGSIIFLAEPATLALGQGGSYDLRPLIPEEDWNSQTVVEFVVRGVDGKRYAGTTADWTIQ